MLFYWFMQAFGRQYLKSLQQPATLSIYPVCHNYKQPYLCLCTWPYVWEMNECPCGAMRTDKCKGQQDLGSRFGLVESFVG